MKKGLLTLASVAVLTSPLNVMALGTTAVKVEGPKTTNVNDTIQVNVKLADIKDTLGGIVAFGGDLKYDKEYLEYVGSTSTSTNYDFMINENNLRIAGLDFTLNNGIKNDSTVYTFTFKVLKEGNTTVDFINPDVVDVDSSDINATVEALNITINNKVEEEPVKEEVVFEKEVKVSKEAKKVVKEEVKETNEEETIKNIIKKIVSNIFKSISSVK